LVLTTVLMMVAAADIVAGMVRKFGPVIGLGAGLAMAVTMFVGLRALRDSIQSAMGIGAAGTWSGAMPSTVIGTPGDIAYPKERMYDLGGPVTSDHRMAILQKGETVNSKTQNMLDGGITLNIEGDIVTNDAEDFAERIAEALPLALRRQNDMGGI